MLGALGISDMLFILLLALLIFGPRRLPEMGRILGKALAEFRKASNELKRSLNTEIALEEKRNIPPPARNFPYLAAAAAPAVEERVEAPAAATASPEEDVPAPLGPPAEPVVARDPLHGSGPLETARTGEAVPAPGAALPEAGSDAGSAASSDAGSDTNPAASSASSAASSDQGRSVSGSFVFRPDPGPGAGQPEAGPNAGPAPAAPEAAPEVAPQGDPERPAAATAGAKAPS